MTKDPKKAHHHDDSNHEQSTPHSTTGAQDTLTEETQHLHQHIAQLTQKLQEAEEITKRAQSDYLRIKLDFDSYIQRNQQAQVTAKIDALCEVARKILPSVNHWGQTLKAIPADLLDNSRVEGVRLTYDKVIQELALIGITPIDPQTGDDVDFLSHLPIATESVDDEQQKGKIVALLERGYKYDKGDHHQVILPAKVSVGA